MRSADEIAKDQARIEAEAIEIQRERSRLGVERFARVDELRRLLRGLNGWDRSRDDVEAKIARRITELEKEG